MLVHLARDGRAAPASVLECGAWDFGRREPRRGYRRRRRQRWFDDTQIAPLVVECVPGSSCVTQIAAGSYNACAIVNGAVFTWGYDLPVTGNYYNASPNPTPGFTTSVDSVATGISHRCAVASGEVHCWGDNAMGQLGNGSTVASPTPVPVGLMASEVGVSAAEFSCALSDQRVYCWGSNGTGQLGNGSTTPAFAPVPVSGLKKARSLAVGGGHVCALDKQGRVYCWGDNESGQLGNGKDGCPPNSDPFCGPTCISATPIRVAGLHAATAVTAGFSHACAIVSGAAYCWGSNSYGELGDGTTTMRTEPVSVQGLPSPVTQISAGGSATCAIANGTAYCWGGNWRGQLGNGTTQDTAVPVPVTGLGTPVMSLVAGGEIGCAIVAGEAYCWGSNVNGQVGSGSSDLAILTPAHVVFP